MRVYLIPARPMAYKAIITITILIRNLGFPWEGRTVGMPLALPFL